MKFFKLLLVFLFARSISSLAQEGLNSRADTPMSVSSIKGKIIDENNLPVEFAAVSIFRLPKDTLINGMVTNNNGDFELENLRPGKYKLSIAFMGYVTLIIDTLFLRKEEQKNIGTLVLKSNEKILKEVTVETQQDMVKNTIDKKVFDAEKLVIANGGSANDVLSQVPTVSVDIDGNISLRGSGNVTILIDGRPSGMSGAGRAGVLSGIPASAIESVEVITNPSAKYDPDGMSGIINIVLKKNKLQGTNGNVTLSAGTNNKYNGNVSYNFRKNKVNIYSNYSFRYNERYGRGDVSRTTYLTDSVNYLVQKNNSDNINRNHSAKIGMDYNVSKSATLGFNITLNYENKSENEWLFNQSLDEFSNPVSEFNRYSNSPSDGLSQDYNINYRQKLKNPKQLVTAESNLSVNNNLSNAYYQQDNFFENYQDIVPVWSYQNNRSTTDFSINTNTLDFESPFLKNGKIESGLKNTNRKIDNDFYSESFRNSSQDFVADDSLNNRFIYYENIYAGYTSVAQSAGKWSFKAGLRAEQANTKSILVTTENTYHNNYFNVFPSAFINRKINEKNEIQFNYGRRINRPGTRQLSPFTDYSNPLILRVGNPYLKPEYTHNFELSYLYNHKKINFSTTFFYRITNGLIMRNISINSNNQSVVSFTNLGSSENRGIETVSRLELFKWWNITVNLNGFQTTIKGTNQDGEINTSNLSWNTKFLTNILFKKGWSIQASGSYNARNIMPQGNILPMSQVDCAVKKDLFKNKATLSLGITDIFDKMRFRMSTAGSNFSQQAERKRETRVATLSFNYRFGSGDFAPRKTKNKESEYKNDEGGF